jgi:beta-galactosidase
MKEGAMPMHAAPADRHLPLDDGWTMKPKVSSFVDVVAAQGSGVPVTLPHDAMRDLPRSEAGGEGPWSGFYPGGVVEYTRVLDAPEHWRDRHIALEFDGVYRDAMVFVNDAFAGQSRNGYVPFRVPIEAYLRFGASNTIRVEARAHQDSRWYSGLGIHRSVNLLVTPRTHIAPDGVRVVTVSVEPGGALLEVAAELRNDELGLTQQSLTVALTGPDGTTVAEETVPATVRPGTSAVVRRRFWVRDPDLWDPDHPALHQARITLHDGSGVVDEEVVTFGIRTLALDPEHGLRVNGRTVKLRGACVHHDNGPLGAAAVSRAEERRVEILKSAGFNAIRSSHNPTSRAMLEACDRLGVLVVDEAFDMWFEAMRPFDYSLDFPEWWERDLAAMVARDANHPSVIMYSIGNEVPEAGTVAGPTWSRDLAERVRELDPTRFTTNAVSSFWAVSGEIRDALLDRVADMRARGVNDVMNGLSDFFAEITQSELVTERTAETHATVDVAGLNYASDRYEADARRFPRRVMLGTENTVGDVADIWPLVERLPSVIGDFTWTGWDYLGEAGLGRTDHLAADETGGGDPDWPWLLAWCGDIDITGCRRPASYYREIVWGLRREPYLAVLRPQPAGTRPSAMSWAWSDSVSSWTWDVAPGAPLEVEVYSDADEVEKRLDGHVVCREPAGPEHRNVARFTTPYQPGRITAVALDGGVERAHTSLRTATDPGLALTADRSAITADHRDLAFVEIELRDADGTLVTVGDRAVSVEVTGPARLQALGSARPATEERFDATTCTTFDGRALAVVRPTGPGTVVVTARCEDLAPASLRLDILPG